MGMINTSDPARPDYVRPEAMAVRPDLDLIDDQLGGTRRMWDQAVAQKYIRKWTDEAAEVYAIRRQCESLFEGLARVLSAAVGMLFAKPPAIVWNAGEEKMEELLEDVDGANTAWPVYAKRFSEKAISGGLALILTDHPSPPPDVDVVTDLVAEEFNLRPIWQTYCRRQILSWRTAKVRNRVEPIQVVLEECEYADTGTYGVTERKRYRVLRLLNRAATATDAGGPTATWELYEEVKDASVLGGFKTVGAGVFRNKDGEFASSLPVDIAYTGRTDAPFCASLPLLGVAFANLSHYRLSTEAMFGRMVAAIEQPVITGELAQEAAVKDGVVTGVPGRLKLGWLTAVHVTGDNADFKWVGPSGSGLDQLDKGIAEKLQQIGQMGMSFLVSDTRAAETARAKELDATAENSTLATAATGIEDALNGALARFAWYLGIPAEDAPVITINKDFTSTVMDPAVMTVYIDAVQRAGLDPMIMLKAWQKGGRIPADEDLEELLATMEANIVAKEAQAERDAADRVAALQEAGVASK